MDDECEGTFYNIFLVSSCEMDDLHNECERHPNKDSWAHQHETAMRYDIYWVIANEMGVHFRAEGVDDDHLWNGYDFNRYLLVDKKAV